MSDEELDLSALPDDELTKQMHDDLYDGLADEIVEGTNILLGARMGRRPRAERGARRGHAHRRASTSATGSCSCPRCCWRPTR